MLFVGLGGAGQRHLRIFKQILPKDSIFASFRRTSRTPLLRPDFTVNESNTIEEEYGLHMYQDLESAFASGPDLTVISTPTSCHREPMMMAMEAGSGVFVEKPWAENLEGFEEFGNGMLAKGLPFHISFQRRYHPLLAQARHVVVSGALGKLLAAEFIVYSNVPSWHPYEDWRELYAVRADLGGGVLLTEIHEIDLANWFFGVPDAVFCAGGNRCLEPLDVEDTVQMTLLYPGFSVQVTLCFMHQRPSRRIHIAGTDGDIEWSDRENCLRMVSFSGEAEEFRKPGLTNDDMFIAQAESFLKGWSVENTKESIAAAGNSLAIVEAARRSLGSGQVERVVRAIA